MNTFFFSLLITFLSIANCHAISLDQFKANIVQTYPDTYLAKNFDKIIQSSIVTKSGAGERKMLLFTDPYCPFCLKLGKSLELVDDVTVYLILTPIDGIHPKASLASEYIWCSKNKEQAATDWFSNKSNKLPEKFDRCNWPAEMSKNTARSVDVYGTPTIIFSDGTKHSGAIPLYQLESRI